MYSDGPFAHKQWKYPPANLSNSSSQRLAGDSGATANNTIAFIKNNHGADTQFEHFVPNQTSGLTLNGLGRINRSIEAFGYCILGAQANTRTSILGSLGTARNTQTDFLVLIEDSIITLTILNGPVKYQDAIQATKVRLNFAVCRGVLLLPARMIINTESIVGAQQQPPPGHGPYEAWCQQPGQSRHEEGESKVDGGWAKQGQPPKQPPLKPSAQTGNRSPGDCTRNTRTTHTTTTTRTSRSPDTATNHRAC